MASTRGTSPRVRAAACCAPARPGEYQSGCSVSLGQTSVRESPGVAATLFCAHDGVSPFGIGWSMMVAKRLPNEREAQVGATVAAANAAGLLSDADLLAGVGRHGSALSLAVLAFEESVKARTLGAIVAAAAQGRTRGFAEDDLRKIIYSSHQARHEAGRKQHLAATDPDLYGRLMLGMATSPAETAKLQALDALLASANTGKQSGFFSDFDPSAGSWTSPADVSKVGFDQIRPLIGDYVTETKRQLAEFTRQALSIPEGNSSLPVPGYSNTPEETAVSEDKPLWRCRPSRSALPRSSRSAERSAKRSQVRRFRT